MGKHPASVMKKILLTFFCLILIFLFLSRCVISKERWSDAKAHQVFESKNISISTHDTLIGQRHIHYAITGRETLPTLVFIHGSPGSWFHYFRYMSDTDLLKKYRIVSFDRPGFGYSNFGEAMHLQEQCKLILPVLQKLKNDQPIILCGHSYGGPMVAKLAADAPGLFEKIIIAAGALDPEQEKIETWRRIMEYKPLCWFLPGAFKPSNTELLYLKQDLIPLAADFKKITCKVIFIHGDRDLWVPIGNIDYGQKMMINAASIHSDTIRGANHNFPWNKREEFKRLLLNIDSE
jgi:pimeloyl-ACP methyl ester carboxylesterase